MQYGKWITGIVLHGDFGQSFQWNRPVIDLILDRLPLTILISVATILFTWLVSFPIGVYSAVNQYSIGDYIATTIGFLGLAVPNFLIALVLMYIGLEYFGHSVGGLFSPEFVDAPWTWAKFVDLLAHLWVPVVVLGTAGTAALIRILRANLLDELHKPYVVAARARGGTEGSLLVKYPLRVALNPFVSTIGWLLPLLISGDIIVGRVLSLPTTGPLLLNALISQDMYLAGSIIMIVSVLTVIGTLLSDILLAWLDPRIRLQARRRAWSTISRSTRTTASRTTPGRHRRRGAVAARACGPSSGIASPWSGSSCSCLIYLVAIFAEFLAPTDPPNFNADYAYAPPQAVHLGEREGGWGSTSSATPSRSTRTPTSSPTRSTPTRRSRSVSSCRGSSTSCSASFPADRHLIGPSPRRRSVLLLGADQNGRDLLSRTDHRNPGLDDDRPGRRRSSPSCSGVTLGGISGYFGGVVDTVIQRVVEFFMSIPTLPLWLGLTAALPKSWSPTERYIAITIILAGVAWTDLARVVRGRFISLREEDFVTAARLDGNSHGERSSSGTCCHRSPAT